MLMRTIIGISVVIGALLALSPTNYLLYSGRIWDLEEKKMFPI